MSKRRRRPKFGATGRHPQGRITPSDEGELQFGVANDGSTVIMSFGKEVAWLGLEPAQARQLAGWLIKHADEVEAKAH